MKKEVSPLTIMLVIGVVACAVLALFWHGLSTPGVKTEKPPKPNPPGGMMPAESAAPKTGAPPATPPPPE